MPIITVISPDISTNKTSERKLYWYDTVNQTMLYGSGERLGYSYQYDPDMQDYRLLPKVITAETVTVKDKTLNKVKKWFDNYKNYNSSEAYVYSENKNNNSITFDVPDEEIDDFLEDLSHHKLKYNLE